MTDAPEIVERCPLCHRREAVTVESFAYEDIWSRLKADFSSEFSPVVVRRHTPSATTDLVQCRSCALQYFRPSVPGDPGFYGELMGSGPHYEEDRWEFRLVADLIPPGAAVLDAGCGEGAFLRRVAPKAARAAGVDANADAVRRLREAGIEAYDGTLDGLVPVMPGAFDVVTAFHVLEHLPRVELFVEPALRLLRPGGRIFISVPNRDRFAKPDLEPLDCPPHHVSRWCADQLRTLAASAGLRVGGIHFEEPDLSHARIYHESRYAKRARRLAGPLWGVPRVRRRLESRVRDRLTRAIEPERYEEDVRRGFFARRKVYGHSLLADLEAPSA